MAFAAADAASEYLEAFNEPLNDAVVASLEKSMRSIVATAAGVALNHHRDLLRQVATIEIESGPSESALEIEKRIEKLEFQKSKGATDEEDELELIKLKEREGHLNGKSWAGLVNSITKELVSLGVSPAGPKASLQNIGGAAWYQAYEPKNGESESLR